MRGIDSYDEYIPVQANRDTLNLVACIDEYEFLINHSIEYRQVISSSEFKFNEYQLEDPFGENRLLDTVCKVFYLNASDLSLVTGSGVNTLLQSMAYYSSTKSVAVIGNCYPDVIHYRSISNCNTNFLSWDLDSIESWIRVNQGGLLFIENPSLACNRDIRSNVRQLLKLCADCDVEIIADESNANYFANTRSLCNLVSDSTPLVVLRGFSKGYSLSGLRVGYALGNKKCISNIRPFVAAMSATSLSIQTAKAILQQGDILDILRNRIFENKNVAIKLLSEVGFSPIPSDLSTYPYIYLPCSDQNLISQYSEYFQVKKQPLENNGPSKQKWLYRLSVPITEERLLHFISCFC